MIQIHERKITKLKKPDGGVQYLVTIPKPYSESLRRRGITSLLAIFNCGCGMFPKEEKAEEALTYFLKMHDDLRRFFGDDKEV